MKFTLKQACCRIEQLRDEIVKNVGSMPSMAIQWDGNLTVTVKDEFAISHESQIQSVVTAHEPNMIYFEEEKMVIAEENAEIAKSEFINIPNWATWNVIQVEDYIQSAIFDGKTKSELDNAIDGITNINQIKPILKQTAEAILAIRTVLKVIAKILILFRDIIIKRLFS